MLEAKKRIYCNILSPPTLSMAATQYFPLEGREYHLARSTEPFVEVLGNDLEERLTSGSS
jgi:hypothetical protein